MKKSTKKAKGGGGDKSITYSKITRGNLTVTLIVNHKLIAESENDSDIMRELKKIQSLTSSYKGSFSDIIIADRYDAPEY